MTLQYLFQAFGARGPTKYRDMLMETGTEEIGHVFEYHRRGHWPGAGNPPLYNDRWPGMKDMLSFLIARDTMHQQQWLAVLAGLQKQGDVLPIPNSFPQELENQQVNYLFLGTNIDPEAPIPQGRWSQGTSLDGKSEFSFARCANGPGSGSGTCTPGWLCPDGADAQWWGRPA